MATFITIRPDPAIGTPTEVVLSRNDLVNDLTAPLITVYIYIGQTSDRGWQVGKAACALLAMARPWCVDDITELRTWVPQGNPAGIVFGFDDQPDQFLTEAEVVILKIVRNAIVDAL